MSKMDELRALREARYEQTLARAAAHRAGTAGTGTTRTGATSPDAPGKGRRPARRATAAERAASGPATSDVAGSEQVEPSIEPPAAATRLCGHRAISGRTCTREHGHAAKSHRYS